MSGYFFLGSVLPSIKIGIEPEMVFEELITLYQQNLTASDFEQVKRIQTYIDLKNVQNFLKKDKIDQRGLLSIKDLDKAFDEQEGLPTFVFDFFKEHREMCDQFARYSQVFTAFFQESEIKDRGFLKDYFRFERKWKVVIAGYRAKNLGIDIATALRYEDSDDLLIKEILAQKEAPVFAFPIDFIDLGEQLKRIGDKPDQQYRLMAQFLFDWIEDRIQDRPFSIDYLLGYLLQLIIVEDFFALDEESGNKYLKGIV